MNYYPFHIGDYVSATRHLSWDEDAAYRRLLDVYYTHEEPIPLDERKVFRLVMATTDAQREAVITVLEEFFEQTDSGWVNHRADAEILSMQDRQQKQRDKANKRWHKPHEERGIAAAMPQHTEAHATALENDANAMPPTPTPTPTPTPKEKNPPTPLLRGADKFDPLSMILPDCIRAADWAEWVKYRRSRRLTCSEATMVKQLRFLTEANTRGNPPSGLIDTAIRNGWQGLFEPTKPAARSNSEPVRRQAREVYS
jgi:uncharacterized protein YdaU (DUF1376 family)